MRIICAWCKFVLGEESHANALTTHTICDTCLETHMRELDNENGSECATTEQDISSIDSISDWF